MKKPKLSLAEGAAAKSGSYHGELQTPNPEPEPPAPAKKPKGRHLQTSTGYMKSTGEAVRRVSIHLTDGETLELKRQAMASRKSMTDYVKDRLKLDKPNL